MAVFRVEKTKNYTVMSNFHLDDPRLSLKAVGLLSKMLRQPDDWDYTAAGLQRQCREGRDTVRRILRELEEAGYIRRYRTHGADGAFSGIEYVIYEAPRTEPQEDIPEDDPDGDAPQTEKPSVVKTPENQPLTENPASVKPSPVNKAQLSTIYIPSTNIPPYNPPTGGKRPTKGSKSDPSWEPAIFERLWQSYPDSKVAWKRQRAARAWDKLRPDADTIKAMSLGLHRQMQSQLWQTGVGIPYLSTWLNQRRWEGEDAAPADEPASERAAPGAGGYAL